jgi:hypothetical protein
MQKFAIENQPDGTWAVYELDDSAFPNHKRLVANGLDEPGALHLVGYLYHLIARIKMGLVPNGI